MSNAKTADELVARLREKSAIVDNYEGKNCLLRDAADEIERLTADRNRLWKALRAHVLMATAPPPIEKEANEALKDTQP